MRAEDINPKRLPLRGPGVLPEAVFARQPKAAGPMFPTFNSEGKALK